MFVWARLAMVLIASMLTSPWSKWTSAKKRSAFMDRAEGKAQRHMRDPVSVKSISRFKFYINQCFFPISMLM